MKRFKGMKTLEQIRKDCEKDGHWELDATAWEKNGSDWFWVRDMDKRYVQALVNCWGNFFAYIPGTEDDDVPVATERSVEYDGTGWYDDLLSLLYVSI
jgi:hypothetical protein